MTSTPGWNRLPRRLARARRTQALAIVVAVAIAVAIAAGRFATPDGDPPLRHAQRRAHDPPFAPRTTPASDPTTTGPPTNTGPPASNGPPSSLAPLRRDATLGPQAVAAAFATAYLTFHWTDGPDAVRRRCRPWDTDEVDALLGAPGVPPDRIRRAASHESDLVDIHAVNPEDAAADHLDASVAATVTIARQGQPTTVTTEIVDLRVVAGSAGWAVAEVSE